MYCEYCGKKLTGAESYCGNCGSPVPVQPKVIKRYTQKTAGQPILTPDTKSVSSTAAISSFAEKNPESVTGIPAYLPQKTDLTTGCKVWFWIVVVMNALILIGTIGLFAIPFLFSGGTKITQIIISVGEITGALMILLSKKRSGFYTIIAVQMLGVIVSLFASGTSFFSTLIGAGIHIGLCYIFVHNNEDILQ